MANGDNSVENIRNKGDLRSLFHEKKDIQEKLLAKYNGGVAHNGEVDELKQEFAAVLDKIQKLDKKCFPDTA